MPQGRLHSPLQVEHCGSGAPRDPSMRMGAPSQSATQRATPVGGLMGGVLHWVGFGHLDGGTRPQLCTRTQG